MGCPICHTSGGNMRKCTKCGVVFCEKPKCVEQRFGITHRSGNICPQCGGCNTLIIAK